MPFYALAFLLSLATALPAAALPEGFQAEYTVRRDGTRIGRTVWTLAPGREGTYLFRSVTRATGLFALFLSGERSEESVWTWHEGRPRPLRYRYLWTGRKGRDVTVDFDWKDGTARNTHGDEDPWTLEVAPETLDKFLYLLVLMDDLAGGRQELRYRIADGGKLKTYRVRRQEREVIDTPLGPLETVRLYRPDPKGKRDTTLWAAPALDYLPVQVEHQDDDEVLRMVIETVEGIPLRP
jgi:hypothetical protein